MFKAALFTLVASTTISNGVTHAFDKLQTSAQNVNAVYSAAGQILDVNYADPTALNAANEKLFAAGDKLVPLQQYALNGANY